MQKIIIALMCLTVLLATADLSLASQKPTAPVLESANTCGNSTNHAQLPPILKNTKGINLRIYLPSYYADIIKCHNRETEGWCRSVLPGTSHNLPDATLIQEHQRIYASFPAQLLPEKLTTQFLEEINSNLVPQLDRHETCGAAKVNILNDVPVSCGHHGCPQKSLKEYVNAPENLTVTVTVRITEESHMDRRIRQLRLRLPRGSTQHTIAEQTPTRTSVALISAALFRFNCGTDYDGINTLYETAIPLNMSQDEIAKDVDKFIKNYGDILRQTSSNKSYWCSKD